MEGAIERPKVLVVDDTPENRILVRDTLEPEGVAIALAASGAEALAAIERERFDLVLLDVRMPGIDGFETCARLRALAYGAEVPVVFLTAQRDLETFDRALEAGAEDFLTKPIRPANLVMRVRSLLEARRLSAEVRAHLAMIRKQRDELLRVELQKEQLSAFVVHDLKNPVHSIALQAHVLARDASLGERARAAAQRIRTDAAALLALITNLLDISKAEEGRLRAERAPIDLSELAIEVAESARSLAADRQIAIELEIDPVAARLFADRELARRVLDNLLENAIRHTPKGGRVTLAAAREDGATVIRVRDTGSGIPDEMRERIFEKYVQIDSSDPAITRSGRGLGLLFCRLAIAAHGGTIEVEPRAAPGSTFVIRIPDGGAR